MPEQAFVSAFAFVLVAGAALLAWTGFGLLAMCQERHFACFYASNRPVAPKIRARAAILIIATSASAAIAMALPLCIKAQGAGFGSLLWVLLLTLAALTVSLQLTWAPLCLKPLAWLVSRICQFLKIPVPLTRSNSRG